ncbi:hypothetical protein ACA30_01645 [Virgibacillus soli]|uniref:Uncharacterized protein n=1 Tax=Lederbergia galactosidilytica TaxID=217031 RepID=A0A0Q9YBY4_9BACI|nr:hypothetical protein ACA29_07350 [Lederbergia galactosidilytica]KRG16427.1 hypothetical protein ACA30_01645 [Virgibacillus soli]
MNNMPLHDLIVRFKMELYRLHYSEGSIKYYRMMWKHISNFFENEGAEYGLSHTLNGLITQPHLF